MKATYEELELIISQQRNQLSQQNKQIEQQDKLIKQLLSRISDLENRINKNSKNSSNAMEGQTSCDKMQKGLGFFKA